MGWAGLGVSESPLMLTVPRSGRPGRGTRVRSWSSGRLGERRSRELSQWPLCKERGWRKGSFSYYILLLPFIYFYWSSLTINPQVERVHVQALVGKLEVAPEASGLRDPDGVSLSFCILASLIHGLSNSPCCRVQWSEAQSLAKDECIRHLIKTDKPKLKKYHSGQLKDEISTRTSEFSRI